MRGHIFRRGKTYAVVVYLGRDPETGRKRQKWYTARTRKEAEDLLPTILTKIQGGEVLTTQKITVSEYLKRWLKDYVDGSLETKTRISYHQIIEKSVIPAMGDIPLSKLSPYRIHAYLADRLKEGSSATTVRYYYRVLKKAFNTGMRWGILNANPCDRVDPPRPSKYRPEVLSLKQTRSFLKAAKQSDHYGLFLAAVTTGLRQGELLGLRWQDVDFKRGVVNIRQAFYRIGKNKGFKKPKSEKSRRAVVLLPQMVRELRRIQKSQTRNQKLLGSEYEDQNLIFTQWNGRPLHGNNITKRDLPVALKAAKLPRIRFHDLRHSHATALLEMGIHPKIVQERLGHSGIAITLDIYSHVVPGLQEAAVEALSKQIPGRRLAKVSRKRPA